MMDATQLEQFRTILTDQLTRLLAQAETAAAELTSQDGQEIEYIDRASNYTNQEMKLKIKSRESRLINKVRLALERIENGTYGQCDHCEEPISIKRLEARPVTTKCIQCKEIEERMEAQNH